MIDYLGTVDISDVYKSIFALIAGIILGSEREMKDKSAGLKTITIICLGSALFSILSIKIGLMGSTNDPGRIAANIITGIGFLGAGVIFKSGFTVYGLTTAGIIWMSSAIGMSIGFGYTLLSIIFLVSSLLIIYVSKYLTYRLMPHHHNRILIMSFYNEHIYNRKQILDNINAFTIHQNEVSIEKKEKSIDITLEIQVHSKNLKELEDYLLKEPNILGFKL